MPLIASIDGSIRRIVLDAAAAVNGVLTWHPVDDLYPEYKAARQNDESVRPYRALLEARGNDPKGGGKFTPRYVMLLQGTKIVIPDGLDEMRITGEILTDDQSSPFDVSLVTQPTIIIYQPSEAEVIKVNVSGSDAGEVANAVWTHASALAIAARLGEVWGRLGLDPAKPLINGATSISFGDIVLALAETGGAVTVTRQ